MGHHPLFPGTVNTQSYEVSGWDVNHRPFVEDTTVQPCGKSQRMAISVPVALGEILLVRATQAGARPSPPVACRVLEVQWCGTGEGYQVRIADCSSTEAQALAARKNESGGNASDAAPGG